MRRLIPLLLVAAVGLAAASCGGDESSSESTTEGITASGGESLKTITISETEFKLSPVNVEVDKAGTYTFHVVNDGNTTHALEVEGHGLETETDPLSAGSSTDLVVDLPEEGEYEVYCPIGSHREQGMEGRLTVGAGSGSTETGSGETTTSSGGLGY